MDRLALFFICFVLSSSWAVNCPALVPPSDAQILYLQANILSPYQTGSTAILICPLGFLPTGLTTAICGPDGAWNNELGEEKNAGKTLLDSGSCTSPVARDETAATCPDLVVSNGFVSYDLFRPRQSTTSATLFCNLGFRPEGLTVVICEASGTWSDTLGTCSSAVPPPPVISKLLFSNDPGAECPPLDVENGFLGYDLVRPRQPGTSAVLFCNLGYVPSGNTVVSCDPVGTWSTSLGSCNSLSMGPAARDSADSVQCPDLPVENGFIGYDLFRPRQSGTSAILFCNIGFLPTGNTLASCDSTGTWSATLGTCNPTG